MMLTQFYSPIIGGEERHVQDLSIELAQRGHDVVVVTFWQRGLVNFELDRGVRIFRIRSTVYRAGWLYSEYQRRHAPPAPDPEALWALQRIIAREQPDIVHGHNWLIHSFLPLKNWSKARFVVTLHDYSLSCAKKRLMYEGAPCSGPSFAKCLACAANHYGVAKGVTTVVSNLAMSRLEHTVVDMFLPVSQATAVGNELIRHNLPFRVIPNFVPDDIGSTFAAAEPYSNQLPDGEYLLFVGDLSHDKGLHVLLQAYAELENVPPLVLIGRRCPDTPTTFPPNVTVMNSWPHHAVMEAWRRSTIAFAPSVWPEPFGIVAIEAMAAGRPVIASRTGGLEDIIVDGETGFLIPPGDPLALQQAITRLLPDRELRERMGLAGKHRVAKFHASTIVPQIEQVYQTVIEAAQMRMENKQYNEEEQGSYSAGKS